ncbi:hypothetical protein M086_4523, partial [Bacteroides fragilis str. S13 L11]
MHYVKERIAYLFFFANDLLIYKKASSFVAFIHYI